MAISTNFKNERITEDIVRDSLKQLGFTKENGVFVEEQRSQFPDIQKLLQNASKKGSGRGMPEFILTLADEPNLVCVIECKADTRKHQSETLDRFSDYAVDGVLLYADYLSKEKDVLSIAVSGQNPSHLKVSHYLKLKGTKETTELFKDCGLQDFQSYLDQYKNHRFRVDYDNLLKYVSGLNEQLHSKKIPEKERAILFSGILIALEDDEFRDGYKTRRDSKRLANFLIESITSKLKSSNVRQDSKEGLELAYSSIKAHQTLIADKYLIELIREIDEHIRSFIVTNKYHDIISKCYIEFLKYANDDGSLGIVLTPPHITELFCDIAQLTSESVVIDNCCGTGGFLVAAMGRLVEKAQQGTKIKTIKQKIEEIKTKQIHGIEFQNHIFNLAVSNMIIHGDGKSNIWQGDCFNLIDKVQQFKPDVALLNPPYNDVSGVDELIFVENALSALERNGIAIAILPMRCALYQKGAGFTIKERLLQNHTIEAVMSMPDELFYPKAVVCCVMVFKAHIPHDPKKKTWFGYWKDDGLVKVKHRGRQDIKLVWESIKTGWINAYLNKEVAPGKSILHHVTASDEWCAEAYMETDYSQLSLNDFEKTVKEYAMFKLLSEKGK